LYRQFHFLAIFNLVCCSQSSIALKDDPIANVIRGVLLYGGSSLVVIVFVAADQTLDSAMNLFRFGIQFSGGDQMLFNI
jgi:energy-converting hydrogenase Eha subunit C